jgi:nitroreductase
MTAVEQAFAPNVNDVLSALEVASRAPSIHNTQPWRWELSAT